MVKRRWWTGGERWREWLSTHRQNSICIFEACQYLYSKSLEPSEPGITYAWARRMAPSAIRILEKENMKKII